MSSAECFRTFVNDRLTAAAAEIFGAFKNIIVEYEEEISRQRMQMEVVRKPEIKLHRIELPLQPACKEEEEVLNERQLCNQNNSSVDQADPEPPPMKEEQEELSISQEGEQHVVKQETDAFMLTPTYEENDHRKDETLYLIPGETLRAAQKESAGDMLVLSSVAGALTSDQLLSNNSHVSDNRDQTGHLCEKDAKFETKTQSKMNTGERPYVCQTCGKDFKMRRALNSHTRIHTGEKPYICKTCGKDFRYSSDLIVHKRRAHTGEKPHLCKICGKSFTISKSLKEHMRIHTGERPYICKTCGKDFKTRSVMSVHTRTHTSVKPYICKLCDKEFRQNGELNRHMRRVHSGERPHLCKICGKSFTVKYSLTAHMKMHTDERPYTCETCGKRFRRRYHLSVHTSTVHRRESPHHCQTLENIDFHPNLQSMKARI